MSLHSPPSFRITPELITPLGVGAVITSMTLVIRYLVLKRDLLGGFHILIDRPVRVGDTVRLENGQEGEVEDIGWRSTRIRSGSDELIVVPNAKLAQSILTNRTAFGQSSRRIEPRRAERRG